MYFWVLDVIKIRILGTRQLYRGELGRILKLLELLKLGFKIYIKIYVKLVGKF
jgi:hypothetical protein